jgi:sn-glycerol 3-phosphate transport system permease protein
MKRTRFRGRVLPWLLLGPQLLVTAAFFLWPAAQALRQSVLREDAFGFSTSFVGLANYRALWSSPEYLASMRVTAIFAVSTTVLSMGLGLLLAAATDRLLRGARGYTTLLVWPYAVAPAVAGILWWFIFNPTIGILPFALGALGYDWNHGLNAADAMILVVVAAAWKQVSYNFLFFVAGLQSIPASLREAAAIDGAGPARRFLTITLPLLAPTTFFLLIVNLVYAMFDTFAIVDATTKGGPSQATTTLVYKVYEDGFLGLDLGGSAAQSVVLMTIVIALTLVQFRYVERKVDA